MESDTASGMSRSFSIDEESGFPTPEQKLSLHKSASHGDKLDMHLSSGGASSDLSLKEGSAFSSSLTSSSDSEPESEFYVKKRVTHDINNDNAVVQYKVTELNSKFDGMNLEVMRPMDEGNMLEKLKDDMCRDLREKVANYERELELANKVIQTSQEDLSRLKYELAQSATVTVVSKNLHDQFETSCFDGTKLKDDEMKVLELQNKIARLEASVLESEQSNGLLMEELSRTKERLQSSQKEVLEFEHKLKIKIDQVTHEMQSQIDSANENVRALEAELASERRVVSKLQARIEASANDLTNRDQEIQELNFALCAAQENFSNERSHFMSEISVLTEQQKALNSKLDQAELRAKLLEDQIKKCESEKTEMSDLFEAQESRFLADINLLKTELAHGCEQVEVLNKSLDASKFRFDMLMAEKDELTAKLDSLNVQANNEGFRIQQMHVHLAELGAERSRLLAQLEDGERTASELGLRVAELEKEADMQRAVIFERAEEKREAIRQLCFSLEYYRSEYHQLCRAFTGKKRHLVSVP